MSNKKGLSVVEIMIVASLSSVLFMVLMTVMGRSQKTYQIGTHLMNTQNVMEQILSNLNSDFKSLVKLEEVGEGGKALKLTIRRNIEPETVEYRFDDLSGKLTRTVSANSQTTQSSDFGSEGMIELAMFRHVPGPIPWPDHLTVALSVVAVENRRAVGTTADNQTRISIVTQFYPQAIIPNPFVR